MRLRVHQLHMPLDYRKEDILPKLAALLRCDQAKLSNPVVNKRSIDARPRNPVPRYTLSVDVEFAGEKLPGKFRPNEVQVLEGPAPTELMFGPVNNRNGELPVIVGAGPAGLLAALVLAQSGLKPIVLERGAAVDQRADHVEQFWTRDILNPESNVLYGEGGAGLFSDGKLTARTKDKPRTRYLFRSLVECGAPPEIMTDGEPHVGTDLLKNIVPNMRKQIESLGGEFRFNSRLTGFQIENGQLTGVEINESETLATRHCILATGHSARDVYEMLLNYNISLQSKPMAIGVRLEIPQTKVDRAQWGKFAGHPQLVSASFRLTRKSSDKVRACYSFCMCPGGSVISCASSPGAFTTNGMSHSLRGGKYANAAFLVPINPEDYSSNPEDVTAGYHYQLAIEGKAWESGRNYHIPASTLADFLNRSVPSFIPAERSWLFAMPLDLHTILPPFITESLHAQVPKMLRELNGVGIEDALLYGPETRSSSPVRILRDESGQSVQCSGLYPAGEGAGYAGGIVSSAIDGIKAAEAILQSRQA